MLRRQYSLLWVASKELDGKTVRAWYRGKRVQVRIDFKCLVEDKVAMHLDGKLVHRSYKSITLPQGVINHLERKYGSQLLLL